MNQTEGAVNTYKTGYKYVLVRGWEKGNFKYYKLEDYVY